MEWFLIVSAWEAEKSTLLQDMNKTRLESPQADAVQSMMCLSSSYNSLGTQDQVLESLRNELVEKKEKEVSKIYSTLFFYDRINSRTRLHVFLGNQFVPIARYRSCFFDELRQYPILMPILTLQILLLEAYEQLELDVEKEVKRALKKQGAEVQKLSERNKSLEDGIKQIRIQASSQEDVIEKLQTELEQLKSLNESYEKGIYGLPEVRIRPFIIMKSTRRSFTTSTTCFLSAGCGRNQAVEGSNAGG